MATLRHLLEKSGFKIPADLTKPIQLLLDVELLRQFSRADYAELVFFGILLINDKICFSPQQIGYCIWERQYSQFVIASLGKRLRLDAALFKSDHQQTQQIAEEILRDFSQLKAMSPGQIGLICLNISKSLQKLVGLAHGLAIDIKRTNLLLGPENPFILGYQLGPNPAQESCLRFDWSILSGYELEIASQMIQLLASRDRYLERMEAFSFQRHGFKPSEEQLHVDSTYAARSLAENRAYKPRIWRSQSASLIRLQQRQAFCHNPDLLASYEDQYQALMFKMTNQSFKDRFKHLAMISNLSLIPVPNFTEIIYFMFTYGVGGERDNQQSDLELKAIFDELCFNSAVYKQLADEFINSEVLIRLDKHEELDAMAIICDRALLCLEHRLNRSSSYHRHDDSVSELKIQWAKLQKEIWLCVQDKVMRAIVAANRPGLST